MTVSGERRSSEEMMEKVVVVGGGLAGLRACEGLRSRGYDKEIVLVGDEEHAPYDRPPLSKQFLAGEWGPEKVALRTDDELSSLRLERRRGAAGRAAYLDLGRRAVGLMSGEELTYDGLVIATGARARNIPGFSELSRCHLLRSLDDAASLRQALTRPSLHLLVVGAGFIGMEVAATARRLGATVTVVEPLSAPLERALGRRAGAACEALHRANGVSFHLGCSVSTVRSSDESGVEAVLSDGSVVCADEVLVGVGAAPNVSWLEGSGLEVGPDGVGCDETLSAAPGVVAAGDVCRWPYSLGGGPVRLEHRTNAAEQGEHAAGRLLGDERPFETVPYVWSDQYEMKIQLLGLPLGTDDFQLVAGTPGEGRFAALYSRDGVVTGALGFSMPRLVMKARSLLTEPTAVAAGLGLFE